VEYGNIPLRLRFGREQFWQWQSSSKSSSKLMLLQLSQQEYASAQRSQTGSSFKLLPPWQLSANLSLQSPHANEWFKHDSQRNSDVLS
jgi:hypothetical protein